MTDRRGDVVRIAVVAPNRAAIAALNPLFDVWGDRVSATAGPVPDPEGLAALADRAEAVLVIGPRVRSPRTVLPGPCVQTGNGRSVPVAWLPDTGDLGTFARAAARVHRRAMSRREAPRTFAVLGERQPRFDRLAERVLRLAREDTTGRLVPARWTAYEVDRGEVALRLGRGPGLAVYVGHGRPVGWVGYAGLRAHHLEPYEPVGALVSLTCRTASRRRTGLSFAEALPLRGVAAATLGAVGPTLHTANARWALRLTRAASTASTIGDLVAAVAPHDPAASAYRLIGDPTAPLLDAAPAPHQEAS
jgi:hypothetical protein